ncbi:hypothetical protein ATANTOWER_026886, partial [Ataeniobius toweri]|nr:hypothetical protein [Ataeniobius toweri]
MENHLAIYMCGIKSTKLCGKSRTSLFVQRERKDSHESCCINDALLPLYSPVDGSSVSAWTDQMVAFVWSGRKQATSHFRKHLPHFFAPLTHLSEKGGRTPTQPGT